jgi:hypothetical protein
LHASSQSQACQPTQGLRRLLCSWYPVQLKFDSSTARRMGRHVNQSDWEVPLWLRQEAVHERFRAAFERHFLFKRVPHARMDAVHQHALIDILLLRRRSTPVVG